MKKLIGFNCMAKVSDGLAYVCWANDTGEFPMFAGDFDWTLAKPPYPDGFLRSLQIATGQTRIETILDPLDKEVEKS